VANIFDTIPSDAGPAVAEKPKANVFDSVPSNVFDLIHDDQSPLLADDVKSGRIRILQPEEQPDTTAVTFPGGKGSVVAPSKDFLKKLAGPTMPPSQPGDLSQLPPDAQRILAQATPQPTPQQPPVGPLVVNGYPAPSAASRTMNKFGVDAAGHAMQVGATKAGQKLDLAGRVLAAAVADTSIELSKGPFSDDELSGNVKQVLAGETPDYELESKFLPKSLRAAESGAYGLVKSAPQLAGVAAAQAVGIPAPISAGVLFGLTPQGFDPKQAALGAALPFAGKYGGVISEAIAKRMGISSTQALAVVDKLGAASSSAGLIGMDQVAEIMKLPPEQREKAWVDAVGNVTGMGVLGLMGGERAAGPDFRGMSQAEKAAYGGEQTARMLAGNPLLPEPPATPTPDTSDVADFMQQRAVPSTFDLTAQHRAPVEAGQAAAPPPATVTPPEAPTGMPERPTTITQRFIDELRAKVEANRIAQPEVRPGEQPPSVPQPAIPATVEPPEPVQQQARLVELQKKNASNASSNAGVMAAPASEEPSASQPREASVPTPGRKVKSAFYVRPRSDGVPDILDDIQELGGIKPPGPGAGGEYDGYSEAMVGPAKMLRKNTGQPVDRLIGDLQERGYHRIQNADDVWDAIKAASTSRDALKAGGGGYEAQTERFWSATTSPNSKSGLIKISVDDLKVGDTFRVRAPGVSHDELTVVGRDPKTGVVSVKDGTSFGRQDVPQGSEIWVQKKSAPVAGTKFSAGQESMPLGDKPIFGAPESVSDQAARLAREKSQAAGKAAKGAMLDKAAAPLTGADVDTTKEMFGRQVMADKSGQQSFFAKDEKPGRGITPDQTKRVSDSMSANFRNAPETVIHNTPDTLPDAVKRAAKAQGVNLDNVKAVYHDGKVHLVASNLDSPAEAAKKWLHEAAGHQGVEAVLGDKANEFLDGVYDSYKDKPLMDDLRRRYANADNRTLAREVLAHLAENPASDRTLWQAVVAKVRATLRAAGVKLGVTEGDVQEILRRAVKQIGGTQEAATHFMAGYADDFSKSNNALDAEASGKFPATEVARRLGVPAGFIRDSAPKSGEWHHTSKFYNATDYYDLQQVKDWMEGEGDYKPEGKEPTGNDQLAEWKMRQKAMKESGSDVARGLSIKYLEWGGTRNHPVATEQIEHNVTIERKPGQKMVTITRPDGSTFRKGLDTRGFEIANEKGSFLSASYRFDDAVKSQKQNRPDVLGSGQGGSSLLKAPEKPESTGNQGKASIPNPESPDKASFKMVGNESEPNPSESVNTNFAAGDEEKPFTSLKSDADAANERRQKAYEALNAAKSVTSKNVTPEMQAERRAADMQAREAGEALRRHPAYIEDTINRYSDALKQLEAAKAVGDPEKLAQARAHAESFHDEFAQMPSRTFTQVWNRMQEEGKLPKSVELPPGRSLSNLTDWLRTAKIDSPKVPLMDRLRLSDRAAQLVRGAKDAVSATGRVAAAGWETLRDSMIKPPIDDDYRRIIKEWGYADNFTGQEGYDWTQRMKEKMPDPTRRAALSVWLDANGDEDEIRAQRADLQGVPSARQHLKVWDAALKLTDTEKQIANSIRSEFETKLEDSKNVGILDKGRKNYGVPQLWNKYPTMPPDETTGMGGGKSAANWRAKLDPRDPFFALQRTVPSYFEGIMHGGEPRTLDVMPLVDAYNQAFHKNITSRAVIWNLKDAEASDKMPCVKIGGGAQFLPLESGKRQLLVDSHSRPPGAVTAQGVPYKYLDHWALKGWTYQGSTEAGSPILVKGDFWVHPEIYDKLNNELNGAQWRQAKPTVVMRNGQSTVEMHRTTVGAIGNTALKVSSFLKNSKMAMGMFHLVNVGTHSVWNGVNPITSGFRLDLLDPKQADGVRNGLELGFGSHQVEFQEGQSGAHGGLWSHVPGLGQLSNAMTDFIFKQAIPAMKMKNYLALRDGNEARYGKQLTPDQISELSAHQANAAFGLQNYRLLGSNKVLMDLNRLACLAPDFLSSELKMGGQALTKYGGAQRRAIIIQTAVMYSAARVINAALNNGNSHWEPENALSVIYNGRRYSIRSVVADLFGLVSNFPGFAAGRLGPLPKIGIESMTGRDMRTGANINTWTKFAPARATEIALRDAAGWLAPIGTTGLLPGAAKRGETPLGSLASAQVGLSSRQYTAQTQMWDAASKFNRNSPDPKANLYQKERDAEAKTESAYRGLDNLLLAGKMDAAQKEYQALIQEGRRPAAIASRYKSTNQNGVAARPFTGSQARDQQMLAAQPELRTTYQEAMRDRQALGAAFSRMPK
jgi:vacuolar-type H+-ATPase subunit E/Vma4